MSNGANHSRLLTMTYPGAINATGRRIVHFNYDDSTGLNDRVSRIGSISDDSGVLESLTYLGGGTVVARSHPQSGIDLTYVGTGSGPGGDKYTGLDRFGRIADQRWKTATADVDRYKSGFDRNSNRLYRANQRNDSFDELYHANGASNGFDRLNQLRV